MAKIEKPGENFERSPSEGIDRFQTREVIGGDEKKLNEWGKMADWMSMYKGNPETLEQDLRTTEINDNGRMKYWLDIANEKQS